ncbi:FxSxx-COOH system tetratricopeptide repeat protein [Phytohabitans flavus]|uniref:FxSxx-COOH system tetratricopeptide repeat protein n=1 Tax=Phytohabitans flavus TaxID=1076124 RepID=UPI003624F3F6
MAQDLVAELQLLHRDAGRPSYRRISAEIRRQNHMPDTVSHETVSAILRGEGLARWSKVECVVRYLAAMSVHRPNQDEEVRRFHALWLAASDQLAPGAAAPAEPPAVPPPSEPPLAESPDVAPSPAGITPTGPAPHRNTGFTGREKLLDMFRAGLTAEPWQPLILYGLGGVGKTQLAVEYAHRFADEYDLVWWIAAEDRSQATASLAALGERQDWPSSLDMAQTVTIVLSRLELGGVRWLIVLDNAGPPAELASLVPASGGHVVVTTRDAAWLGAGRPIEVDVFARRESIELLRARGHDIDFDEADQLAERLGDLPGARTGGRHAVRHPHAGARVPAPARRAGGRAAGRGPARRLRGHGGHRLRGRRRPGPGRVAGRRAAAGAAVLPGLRADHAVPAAPRRRPCRAPLGRLLNQTDLLDEAVRLLRRYGLVKVLDGGQALQVHRLVQAIVRDTLPAYALDLAYGNAWRLLTSANPGNPSEPLTWDMHAQIGPHLRPARVIEVSNADSRQVIVDQAKYLNEIGDFEGSRQLSQEAWTAWTQQENPDGVRVFACLGRLVAALQALGRYTEARELVDDAWNRLQTHPEYGPDHPTSLEIANTLAVLHRVFGRYGEALRLDRDRVERYRRIRGEEHRDTVLARNNLGASLRAAGDYRAAYDIDADLAESGRQELGTDDQRTLLSISNLARDLYGLGDYAKALELQQSTWQAYRVRLGDRHPLVLAAWRTIVLGLRKSGRVQAALEEARRLYLVSQGHVGPDHELSLAAMMTYANTLCAAGEATRAWNVATDAMDRYRRQFGERNPLTLAAATNQAIILRAMGEKRRARQVGESAYYTLRRVLGQDHPYTIAAGIGVGNDRALAHEKESARRMLTQALEDARRVRGQRHPDTLTCAINLGLLLPPDDPAAGRLATSLDDLRSVLGPEHPLVLAAASGRAGECDIEPPPV